MFMYFSAICRMDPESVVQMLIAYCDPSEANEPIKLARGSAGCLVGSTSDDGGGGDEVEPSPPPDT